MDETETAGTNYKAAFLQVSNDSIPSSPSHHIVSTIPFILLLFVLFLYNHHLFVFDSFQMMRNRGSVGRPAFGSSSSPYNNTTSPSPSAMGGARTSSVVAKSGSSSLQLPPDAFPPKFLFTCTVGRNRSKARFSLAAASEVGDLLET